MEIKIHYSRAISNRGNLARIKQVMQRATAGEAITVGFLGGSITQGSLSSTPQLCYAYHVYEWWCHTFPKSDVKYVNAGIGATDSQFGCARVESDLLVYQPDVVIVEYSVNDESTTHFLETYEGVVRKIYGAKWKPAVMLVHNVRYDDGGNAQLIHAKVGRYYDLPGVSMQSTIYPLLVSGQLENRKITPDDLHPNDKGHAMVASVITYYLDQIHAEMNLDEETEKAMPAPMTANAYEDSIRYRNLNATPACKGFVADENKQNGITDIFKNGWTAAKEGDTIRFEVEGSCLAVQYRKTIQLPAPVATLIIDEDTENPITLDANFDETWGDKLVLATILEHAEHKKHIVEITLTETHPDDKLPFYLVSVIGSGR